jgi:hypothetical protein
MRCLICVLPGDVLGDGFPSCVVVHDHRFKSHSFCTKQADIRDLDEKLSMCPDPYRVNELIHVNRFSACQLVRSSPVLV